ncbi:hypothetical protein [Clostridium thermosuccinogenes]|uniref:phage major capsid protein n=1 Tax=Clostridium thermosuccinogenes TaxID=84032 RepID=UPI000CCC88FD|nr:hypothetical protein [Pseudoclostridium thermosuccinogenes]PNT94153.1 hypothetical protein CDQ83_11940 [Pseudoclostridium thermosuccinogenes]
MSVENFKKNIWEARLIANFHSVSIADVITTKPTRVDGAKIIFNRVGAGNVKNYEGTIAWDEITTTPVELLMAQKKYFAFSLDDVDKAQLVADVIDATTKEYADVLAETIDAYVLSKAVAGAKSANKIGSSTTKKEITAVNQAYDYIVDLGTILGKNKVPTTDRYVIINNDFLNLLQKDDRFTRNPDVLANGIVNNAKINGMTIVVSEEVPANNVIALHKSAVGYGKQIDELEAMRLQTSFADGVRGLCVYDAVALRDDAIAVLYYNINLSGQTT